VRFIMRDSFKKRLGTMGTPGDNRCPQYKPLVNNDFSTSGDKVDTFQRVRKRAGVEFLEIGDNATNDYKSLFHYKLNNYMVNRHGKGGFTEEESSVNPFKRLLDESKSKPKTHHLKQDGEAEPTPQQNSGCINVEKCPLCPQTTLSPCAARDTAGDSEISKCPQCPHLVHRDYIDDEFDVMVRDIIARTTEPVRW